LEGRMLYCALAAPTGRADAHMHALGTTNHSAAWLRCFNINKKLDAIIQVTVKYAKP